MSISASSSGAAQGRCFVAVTTEAGRALRWDRAQLESAHEPGEDWPVELEQVCFRHGS
jgi:hypothetical protein